MLRNPKVILDETDDPEIGALKQEVVRRYEEAMKAGPRIVCILLIGLAITVVVGVLEMAIRGQK